MAYPAMTKLAEVRANDLRREERAAAGGGGGGGRVERVRDRREVRGSERGRRRRGENMMERNGGRRR